MNPWIKLIIAAVIGGLIAGAISAAVGINSIILLGALAGVLAVAAMSIANRDRHGHTP